MCKKLMQHDWRYVTSGALSEQIGSVFVIFIWLELKQMVLA